MQTVRACVCFCLANLLIFALSSCATHVTPVTPVSLKGENVPQRKADYASRIPSEISSKEKVIIVDPRVHVWGAYQNGKLLRAGLATAGNSYCPDIHRACRTKAGTFRIQSLGASNCKSTIYPLPKGGAPMPYCMFFNGNQGLHGSGAVVEGNVSHGCVRLRVGDAEWIRFNFANIGTKVIVKPY
jgi:hypothetical protein